MAGAVRLAQAGKRGPGRLATTLARLPMEKTMRSFEDSHGQHWQAALLDGSYGNVMLVFSPLQAGAIRRRALQVSTMAEAMALLAALDEEGLRAMLLEADPWETGVDGF